MAKLLLPLLALVAMVSAAPLHKCHHKKADGYDAAPKDVATPATNAPTYGSYSADVAPVYKPTRAAYPWENPANYADRPGHAVAPGTGYHKKPTNGTYVPGKPYDGAPGKPYVPGPYTKPPTSLPGDKKPFKMTLVHTNDIHSHLNPANSGGADCTAKDITNHKCFGGVARIKSFVDNVRATKPNVYLLDAGDQFQGSMFYNYYKGNVSAEFMNLMKYDTWSLGNHEFDDGPAHLGDFLKKLQFPTVSSNMDISAEPALTGLVAPYTILTKNDVRIGVVGFITQTTPDIAKTGDNLKFVDPVGPVQKAIDELHKAGVQRIISVSHNGYDDDQRVAANTKGLSLIVGGHSHTLLHKNLSTPGAMGPYPTKIQNKANETTFIVQAKSYTEWIGMLDIEWDAEGKLVSLDGNPTHLTDDMPQDKDLQAQIDAWAKPFEAIVKTVIGANSVAMVKADCSSRSCALGNFVADAFMPTYSGAKDIPHFVAINTGGLRADLNAGPVTLGDLNTVLPFVNLQTELSVDGQWIIDTLENAHGQVNVRNGKTVTSYIQLAGLHATVDMSKPAGKRVVSVQIQDPKDATKFIPITTDGKYVAITLDYLATGGDSLLATAIKNPGTRGLMSDIVIDYVKSLKGPIPDTNEARVTFVKSQA
ncbi:Metallo-dependent phosphatase-like protein [Blastocladiella britannica]|nr:Metallo-dependent phosphatase-like protein [Blastocladiella britannica]